MHTKPQSSINMEPDHKGANKVTFRFNAIIALFVLTGIFAALAFMSFVVLGVSFTPAGERNTEGKGEIVKSAEGTLETSAGDENTGDISYQYADGTIVQERSNGVYNRRIIHTQNTYFNWFITRNKQGTSVENVLYTPANGENGTAPESGHYLTPDGLGIAITIFSAFIIAAALPAFALTVFAFMFLYSAFKSIPRPMLPGGPGNAVFTLILACMLLSFRLNFETADISVASGVISTVNIIGWAIGAYILYKFTINMCNAYATALKTYKLKPLKKSTLIYAIVAFAILITILLCDIIGREPPVAISLALFILTVILGLRLKNMALELYLNAPRQNNILKI